MYTVSQAARLVGVPAATLRAWERRYSVIAPSRTEGGYRLYDPAQIELLREMAARVAGGMRPALAAASLSTLPTPGGATSGTPDLVAAAASLDPEVLGPTIRAGLAGGDFEESVTAWLLPQLDLLGEAWASGRLSVAHEHFTSAGLMGALASAFAAAAPHERGPTVLVGLPSGARHELALLAFAVCLRRLGADVLYLGADVPPADWRAAVRDRHPLAAVLAVHSRRDARAGTLVADALADLPVSVWVGGAARAGVRGATPLPDDIPEAARRVHRALLGATL